MRIKKLITSVALMLLSGSVDELMCEIDCTVTDEDEAVIGVHNTESPIAALGFYGADASSACAQSGRRSS